MNDYVISGELLVGPDGHGSYRYGIRTPDGGLVISQDAYHNAASAGYDGHKVQRITTNGLLVPDSRYHPEVN